MKQELFARFRLRNKRRAAPGFSLVEMLIGSAVFVVVLLAIYMILDTSRADYAMGAARSDVQENIRVALESMARELRMAGYAPTNTPNADCAAPPCGVTALTASAVTFQADLDGNTQTDKVEYAFAAPTNLTKPCDPSDATTVGRITRSAQSWAAGAWSPVTPTAYDVAQCVKAVTITYRDSTGAATAVAANVRRITISIQGEENTRGHTPRTYALATDVWLRNF
ncbi:MAG: PilW family protein [Candidatus Methylomirabilis sp.]